MTLNNLFTDTQLLVDFETRLVRSDKTVGIKKVNLIREHLIEVSINETPAFRLVCTPNRLSELVLGRMATEGLIKGIDDVDSLYICESANRASVYLKQGLVLKMDKDAPQIEPTCCTDNKVLARFEIEGGKELKPLERADYSADDIFALAEKFSGNAALHKKTMGTHSCYLSYKGEYKGVFEDIGRHNALDKAVGYALINGFRLKDCILFTTGRVPVDMARKVIIAGIPILASKAVPTAEALDMARRYNLTLICSAWPDSYEVCNEAK